MKKIEKNQLKNIKGGFIKICDSNSNQHTTFCTTHWDNGYTCVGSYTWGGATMTLCCGQGMIRDLDTNCVVSAMDTYWGGNQNPG